MKRLLLLLPLLALGVTRSAQADTALVFNEVMYHPATNEPALEWVEFYNQMAVDIDVSGWSVANGISFQFPEGTIVKGRGFLVLALAPDTLRAAGVTNVLGPFLGRLSNGGDTLELINNSGRLMDTLSYGTDGDWPVAPDGTGVSLAKLDRDTASKPASNWTVSEQMGGTPGADNFPFIGGSPTAVQYLTVSESWKYDGTGTDLGTGWREPAYNDSGWAARSSFTNRTIPGLFNTGIGTDGNAVAGGGIDPHYIVTAAAQGNININATVANNHPSWLANDAVSRWISVTNPGANSINAGGYDYQTTFSLDGFLPGTVRLVIQMAVDNDITNVFLNGQPSGLGFSGFSALSPPVPLSSGFVPGLNTLEFRTVNQGPAAGPGGFRATLSGTGLAVNSNTALPSAPPTVYLRKSFVFHGDPALTALRLNPLVADGAVIYLNGVEVRRVNMPEGTIAFTTPALSNVPSPDLGTATPISAGSLVDGTNVLAVELHQAADSTEPPVLGLELFSTPLPAPVLKLAFNEVAASTNATFWVELVNHGTNTLPLEGYQIVHSGLAGETAYTFPPGTNLDPGAFLAVTEPALGIHPAAGDKLWISPPTHKQVLDAVIVQPILRGRFPAGTGRWLNPDLATPGTTNHFAFHTGIVINEIMHNHALIPATATTPAAPSPEKWIELYNRGTNAVDLTGWTLAGGISYSFPPGTTMAPGSYLVIAKDSVALRLLHPGINIIGDFSKTLGGSGDLIRLLDASQNPANEVEYYSGSNWPDYSGGGGSSLELRDPLADNSKAEAWAASDESGKSAWKTYSYRGPADDVNGPQNWNEFVMGLLSAGECLIDNLSVVESPTNNPVQLITNGNFEDGLNGWRVLGTHEQCEVIPDPDNPGNHVLHLIAAGPAEHMHNHLETTLANNRSIVSRQIYEISYRARWLAGNNLLNTRLYFNRLARSTPLEMPVINGTPGGRNSRYAGNIGPTFSAFQHTRVVPAKDEPVTVSVEARDPQGVQGCEVWWSANDSGWNHAAMTAAGEDRYTATLPGQPAGTIVQFYVSAVDTLGATATYPARGPNSRALYKVEDGQAAVGQGHNFRIIMTPADTARTHALTNVMSNRLVGNTIVVDESRAYYDVGLRLRSSERGRDQPSRVGWHVQFHPDDPFRGVHPVMLVDRSGGWRYGRSPGQDEIMVKHLMNHAGGIPQAMNDLCHVIAPLSIHTSSALLLPRYEDEFLDTQFKNGGDGNLFKYELVYYPVTTVDGRVTSPKLPEPDGVIGQDFSDVGTNKEPYRFFHLIKNHRDADDYSRLVSLNRAMSAGNPQQLGALTRELMDVDEWLRVYAMIALCGIGDTYTWGNNHNMFTYVRPSDGKVVTLPWDLDFAFTQSTAAGLVGDQNWSRVINLPENLRRYYAHMLDLIATTYNAGYATYWAAHYTSLLPGQNFTDLPAYIAARGGSVKAVVSSYVNTAFTINGAANPIVTSNNVITLTGTAPLAIQRLTINGVEYPVAWSNVTSWVIRYPLAAADNSLVFEAYDLKGAPLTNFTRTVTINYTGVPPNPIGSIVFNEIMHHPVQPGAGYVELFNSSSNTSFDLSGWRINGLDYTFPAGTILTNRQFLVLAQDVSTYVNTYSNTPAPFARFNGSLQADGETLSLLRPGKTPGTEEIVAQVRYESRAPWPAAASTSGVALQLTDPTQDPRRVSNWTDALGWRFVSFTGTVTDPRLLFYMGRPGDIFLDDFSLVAGTVAGVGSNFIRNGGFEGPLTTNQGGPWGLASTNLNNSAITSEVKRSGSNSLHLVFGASGGPNINFFQDVQGLTVSNTYTLSFWYLPTVTAGQIFSRLGSGFSRNLSNLGPILSTPGATNASVRSLPPYPPLWINEVQPVNLTGPTNSAGEHAPWLELYNAGTNSLSLAGFHLANNYSNLTQWPFPPDAVLGAGEFRVVFADDNASQFNPAEWHTNFRLTNSSGSVALSRLLDGEPQLVDYLNYDNVPADASFGDLPDGQPITRRVFLHVTPGGTNDGYTKPIPVVINEWMASNVQTITNALNGNKSDDWFELHNSGTNTVDLAGFSLTDTLNNRSLFRIPAGFSIPAGGFLLVWADGLPALNDTNRAELHVNFQLARGGEAIGLYAADGTLVDSVTFGAQNNDVSEGRYPDASAAVRSLTLPTPGQPNSSPRNAAPTLTLPADSILYPGETLSFTARASDLDQPGQTLTFALESAPAGASLLPFSGVFTWTPPADLPPGTNLIRVSVIDNGVPVLGATQSMRVLVVAPPALSPGQGQRGISFQALSNRTYSVEWKESVDYGRWTKLKDLGARRTNRVEQVEDPNPAADERFYRLVSPQQPAVGPGPLILRSPRSRIADVGEDTAFAVLAIGTGTLSYQWHFNGVPVEGGTLSNLVIRNTQLKDAGSYTVQVTDQAGQTTNQPAAALAVRPQILDQPVSQEAAPGSTVTFTVNAVGNDVLRYQWSYNGRALPGERSASLILRDVQAARNGQYQVTVWHLTPLGQAGVVSSPASLIVR